MSEVIIIATYFTLTMLVVCPTYTLRCFLHFTTYTTFLVVHVSSALWLGILTLHERFHTWIDCVLNNLEHIMQLRLGLLKVWGSRS